MKTPYVMIVTPEPLPGPNYAMLAGAHVWLRTQISSLKSLPVDILVLAPGCSEEQRALAIERTRAQLNAKIYELVEATDKPKISDEFHTDEPLAYLVKNFRTDVAEYSVFVNKSAAERHVGYQRSDAREAEEYEDYDDRIFPLYAGDA